MRFWRSRVLGVSIFLGLSCSGGAWAEAPDGEAFGERGIQALERRAEDRKVALRDGMREISEVAVEVDESRSRVGEMRQRVQELGEQVRDLQSQSEAQEVSLAEARKAYEDRARAAYKGDDLAGLFDGVVGEGSITMDLHMVSLLSQSRDDIEQYEDSSSNLENSVRQLEQKKDDYGALVLEERRRTELLRDRERRLDEEISGISENRAGILERIERRLEQLEAAEAADKLKKPVSGGGQAGDREREIELSRRFGQADEGLTSEPVERISRTRYTQLYRRAAKEYGFGTDWYVLAAVGKVESNHGKYLGPSTAGALGPMQFLPSTWSTSGVDGNGDGKKNIMDPEDSIPAAAGYLKAGGAPGDWSAALYTYNHSNSYVKEVLAIAEDYRRQAGDKKAGPYI